MKPYYEDKWVKIYHGDCREILPQLDLVGSIVTDPPYGWSFMGKKWDYDVPSVDIWKACLRVLKPGGHILVCCGTRTQHRMAVNIEDAGFEIRDLVAWVYGSGFPKSLNVAVAIDKKLGHPDRGHRIAKANRFHPDGTLEPNGELLPPYEAKSQEGKPYEGWGTALKPAMELWTLARKPLEGTVAENVLKHGTGGLNIDGCRVGTDEHIVHGKEAGNFQPGGGETIKDYHEVKGRFPANLIHDGSEEVVRLFPQVQGQVGMKKVNGKFRFISGDTQSVQHFQQGTFDSGSASRFFYCAKASKAERNMGLEGFPLGEPPASARSKPAEGRQSPLGQPRQNCHPTVKPVSLMRYLCRLITPKGGTVLDPFMGSGSTGIACKLEGFDFIGIEINEDYLKIAEARIKAARRCSQEVMDFSK